MRSWLGRAVVIAGLIVACSAPRSARGAEGAALAETLFEQGRTAMQQKNYDVACAKFRASLDVDPAVGTLFNLAHCEEQRGRLATAWELYRATITKMDRDDQRRPFAQQRATELESRVPRLTVKPKEGTTAKLSLRLDDTAIPEAAVGVGMPLDPGEHIVTVSAPDHQDRRFRLEVREAQHKTLEVYPGAAVAAARPPPAQPTAPPPGRLEPDRASGRKTLGYVAGGIGIAGVGVGAALGILTLSKKSQFDDECNETTRLCTSAGLDARDAGRVFGVVSTTGFVVGVLGLGASAYLLFAPGDDTAVQATALPGAAALTFSHSFSSL